MEDRENIPEIDPEQGLTAQQAAERTPAGTPVYPGKTEQEIILTHCFTFFNLIFVVLAVMLLIGRSSILTWAFWWWRSSTPPLVSSRRFVPSGLWSG